MKPGDPPARGPLTRRTLKPRCLPLFAAALLASAAAWGQAPESVARRSYTPADFARVAPRNAFDMLSQIPGFSIDQGNTDRRGLGQASGNILINGRRFSGKSADIPTELARISIEDVVRIDIADGTSFDVPGLSGQVANVITASRGVHGNFTWRPEYRPHIDRSRPYNGEASISGTAAGFGYTFSLANASTIFGTIGPEIVTGPNGAVTDRRIEKASGHVDTPQLRASVQRTFANGARLNLNTLLGLYLYDWSEDSLRSGAGMPDRDRVTSERQHGRNYEIGGDYEFALASGRLKLIGLNRFDREPFIQNVVEAYADGSPADGGRFEERTGQSETIARAEYRRHMIGGDWQASLEGARNRLDIDNRLFSLLPSGTLAPSPFPDAVASVEEQRAEIMLSYARPLLPALTAQASIGGEYSRLGQRGAGGLIRTFYRPKGFLSLAWQVDPRFSLGARIERAVGQLNFTDFVASADIGQGTANAGNVNLVPPQSWNVEIRATRDFGRYGNVALRLHAERISDIVDVIPIGATGQAPGNLDRASRYGLQWTSTFKFDPLGWHGARFDLDLQIQGSSLTDPLTGAHRAISQDMTRLINAGFRQDIPHSPWTYGSSFVLSRTALGYRLDLVTVPTSVTRLGIFVENRNLLGLNVRATIDNIFDYDERYARFFYDGRRTNGPLFTEDRHRRLGPMLSLTISGRL